MAKMLNIPIEQITEKESENLCNLQEKTIDGNNTYEFNNSLKLFTLDSLKDLNLNIIDEVKDEQYEDPRVLVHDNKIYVGCANYQLNNVNYIHQKIIVFDDKFNHIHNIHPVYDGNEKNCFDNTKHQKNWTYFIKDGKLMCVYKMYPHTVLEIDFDGTIVVPKSGHQFAVDVKFHRASGIVSCYGNMVPRIQLHRTTA